MKKKFKINKRDVVVLIVVACIIVFVLGKYVIYKNIEAYKYATQMEKIATENENAIFKIDKIVLYSSANAIDNSEGQTMQDLNVCQFTDIAIYIDNRSYIEELTEENTVKELYIDNIKIESTTNKGEKSLKYKSPLGYGKFKTADEDAQEEQTNQEQNQEGQEQNQENQEGAESSNIENNAENNEQSSEESTQEQAEETTEEESEENSEEQAQEQTEEQGNERIDFEVLYTNEDNEKSDYKKPTFYTDCSNPITLNYMNENIVTGYAVSTEDTQIKFDGNILQSVGVNLEDIKCNVSFDIHIKNNLDEEFTCGVGINIPLESNDRSIYNGYMYGMQNNLQNLYSFFKK